MTPEERAQALADSGFVRWNLSYRLDAEERAELIVRVAAAIREAEAEALERGRLEGLERAAGALESRRDIGHEFCAVHFAAAIRALKVE